MDDSDEPSVSSNQTDVDPQRSVNPNRDHANFTRGEKCLFAHFAATFAILATLLIAYLVHLCVVDHTGIIANLGRSGSEESKYDPIGFVYVLPSSYMCNSLILSARWSVAPAHCVAARSDPDLAYALQDWRIGLGKRSQYTDVSDREIHVDSKITRSIPHPHFNRDDFQNNIGLFVHDFHKLIAKITPYMIGLKTGDLSIQNISDITEVEFTDVEYLKLNEDEDDLDLIGWKDHLQNHVGINPVQQLPSETCKLYTSPIVEVRAYEICVALKTKQNVSIMPGAILTVNSAYVGLFSWGDPGAQGTPFVILKLSHYKNWVQHVITL